MIVLWRNIQNPEINTGLRVFDFGKQSDGERRAPDNYEPMKTSSRNSSSYCSEFLNDDGMYLLTWNVRDPVGMDIGLCYLFFQF